MPGENLETVEPTVLDYQEPSFMTEGIEAANAASGSFCDCVIHSGSPGLLTDAGRCAGEEAWCRALVKRDRPHPETVVKTEREVQRASITQPEMFTPPQLPTVANVNLIEIGGESLSKKQLAFAQGTEGNGTRGICAFMKHGLESSLLFYDFLSQRDLNVNARKRPKTEKCGLEPSNL
jgi:hypothetical protein